jgi:hypothetical protein
MRRTIFYIICAFCLLIAACNWGGSSGTSTTPRTCSNATATSSAQNYDVLVVHPVTRCGGTYRAYANSLTEAQQCARSAGYEPVNTMCEYFIKSSQSGYPGYCTVTQIYSSSSTGAQTCAYYNCSNCTITDVTSQVTPYRTPGTCIGGVYWNAVDAQCS